MSNVPRWVIILLLLVASSAGEARAATFTVLNTNDSGVGSLRQAVVDANASADTDVIVFDQWVSGTITLLSQLPPLEDAQIVGPGADVVTISGNSAVRVFEIWGGRRVEISGLTIADGFHQYGEGGGIRNLGTLEISDSRLSNHYGGAIRNGGPGIGGTLSITDSTLSTNQSYHNGGGIYNVAGTVAISNTTLSGNSAAGGGAVFNEGTLTIVNSTLAGNSAVNSGGGAILSEGTATVSNSTLAGNSTGYLGGAIRNWQGTLTLTHSTITGSTKGGIQNDGTATVKNSIIANSPQGSDCAGSPISSLGKNFDTDGSCSDFTTATLDQLALGSLQDNGGPTETRALLPGSVAIDAVPDCTSANGDPINEDQRGAPRPRGPACDAGAVEHGLVVTNTDDSGAGSLRKAILDANTKPDLQTIAFLRGVNGVINLGSALPVVVDALEVRGPGSDLVTISGENMVRVFEISDGVAATISGLSITSGFASSGGGVLNLGTLVLSNCVLKENETDSESGGAIANGVTGSLTLTGSTLHDNRSESSGGGISNAGTLVATNSTFSANTARSNGGAVLNNGTATLIQTTLFANSASLQGGGTYNSGNLIVKNNIFAASGSGGACGGDAPTALGANLNTDATCPGFSLVTPTELNLGPLADNDGPTPTHALLLGSVAIDAAADCTDAVGDAVSVDQRGIVRPQGSSCDVGAFEYGFVVTNTNDSGIGSLREVILSANANPGPDVITFSAWVDGTITLASALPSLEDDIEIIGPGIDKLSVSGDKAVRVFSVDPGVVAAMSALTITSGLANSGGGILNRGTLTLTETTLSGNSAGTGGGVFNEGTLSLHDSTLLGNVATSDWGGGIFNEGLLTLTNSAISSNQASAAGGGGGGLINESASTAIVAGSTFSGNSAVWCCGGIGNNGTLRVINSTLSENQAATAGGLYNAIGTTTGAIVKSCV